MMRRLSFVLGLFVLTGASLAQPLTRVRIDAPNASALADRFEVAGWDVIEGSVHERSLELVVDAREMTLLQGQAYRVTVLEHSQPLKEKFPGDIPTGYPSLAELQTAMQDLAAAHPTICKFVDITTMLGTPPTWEGRNLWALKISDNVNLDEDEPAFLLVACHHAREIITPVAALDAATRLTTQYASNPTVQNLVNKYQIWIVPMANPDGYNHVYNVNSMWRKNRRNNGNGTFGVDQNRNYPFGWTAPCAGSTTPGSDTYKGPSAGSEAETQTIMALSIDRHFCKTLDYHSYGRDVLHEYSCLTTPLASFYVSEATALSVASGYGGSVRDPSAEGEEQEWQIASRNGLSFLTETGTSFQPAYTTAQSESALIWPGVLHLLNRPITLAGHVKNSFTGQPVSATISYPGLTFTNGETNKSEPTFGRYHCFLPAGPRSVKFSAPGYFDYVHNFTATTNTEQVFEVALVPLVAPCYADCNGDGILNLGDFGCFQTKFATGNMEADCNGDTVLNLADFGCFQTKFAVGCP